MSLLTPDDIRNGTSKSGYKCVLEDDGHRISGHGGGSVAYQADLRRIPGATRRYGPRRSAALESAQDYCDTFNGAQLATLPSYAAPVVDMGNPTAKAPKIPTVQIKKRKYTGPHDVYDVIVYDHITGDVWRRKVGITARGEKRYADIATTLGFSIKPLSPAKTYPTKAAALAAETKLIEAVCQDTNWMRVAKEAFAPAQKTEEAT